jgi:hypothetical protein
MCIDATKDALSDYGFTDAEIQAEYQSYMINCLATNSF